MAGSQNIGEASDNPVAINVTAMVDVIFCLCLFFMCSLHFKQLEGKIDSWLPKDRGVKAGPPAKLVMEEIRVILKWDGNQTLRKVGNRNPVTSDEELMSTIVSMTDSYKKAGKSEFPVLIDAEEMVPWADVLHVLDLCKLQTPALERIEFAAPIEYKKGSESLEK